MSSPSTMTSPRLIPTRKAIRVAVGRPAFRAANSFCTSIAERTASTTLGNSASSPYGLLAEFPSVVEAVRSAIDVQNELAARNAGRPTATRMAFRVGINLGDVIVEGD